MVNSSSHKPAIDMVWLLAARIDKPLLGSRQNSKAVRPSVDSGEASMHAEGSIAKMVFVNRLLGEPQKELVFFPPFGLVKGGYLARLRSDDRHGAAPVALATVLSRGDLAAGSIWGTWQ
ncbi:MAG: hypothetical protein ABSG36_14550 [Acidimicrobiales bacterium]|jgi:hypothetical protein